MNKNIKNVKFTEIDSSISSYKEFVVTYNYNGKSIKDIVFIKEKAGLKKSDYLRLAKKEFKPNPKAMKGGLKTSPLSLKIIAACAGVAAVTLGGLFTWKMLTNNPITPGPQPEPEPVVQEYTVKWVDEDGSLMDEEVYKEGEIPAYKGEYHDKAGIFKDDGEEYMHFQEGWEEELAPIKEDTTFHAVYSDRLMVTTMTAEITEEDFDYFPDGLPIGFGVFGTVNHMDWGDGESGEADKHQLYHFYTQPGTYTIKMYGNVKNFYDWANFPDLYPEHTEGNFTITSISYGCSIADLSYGGVGFGPMDTKLETLTVSSAVEELEYYVPESWYEVSTAVNFDKNPRCRVIKKLSGGETLKSVFIPKTVLAIGENAFYDDDGLESVIFEEGSQCKTIGSLAFYDCGSLQALALPDTVESINSLAFSNCANISSLPLPKNLKFIGTDAFSGIHKIESLTIPEAVEHIDVRCFESSGFQSLIFEPSNHNVVIEECAFSSMTSLKSITLPIHYTYISSGKGMLDASDFYAHTSLEEINVPEGITTVDNYEFYESANLKNVTLPSTLKSIGDYSFAKTNFETLDLSNTSLESTGIYSFSGSKLKSIKFPSTIKELGASPFYGCSEIENIEFPYDANIESMDDICNDLSSLVSFTLPDATKSLAESCFMGCTSLTTFNISANSKLREIPNYCFQNCSKLETFNASLIECINGSAFKGTNIKEFKCSKNLRTIWEEAFIDTPLETLDLTAFTTPNTSLIPAIMSAQDETFPSATKFKVASAEMKDTFLSKVGWKDISEDRFIVA